MEGQSENVSDDDIPVSLSFKQLKKEKFILSTNLKNDYEVSKKLMLKKKSFRDPRFDPRVNGICTMNDWASLKEDEDSALKTLKKQLAKVKSDDQRERITHAIKLLRQRQATQKDVNFKRRFKHDLQQKQLNDLQAGKRASFLTRNKLREKIKEERFKNLSNREKKKYMARQSRTANGAEI